MDQEQARMQCVELVVANSEGELPVADIIELAEVLFQYVWHGKISK